MIIGGVDTETTGLEQSDGHRIIEICFRLYDLNSRSMVDSYVQRIDPRRSIDADASAVHGIVASDLIGMPEWKDVAPDVKKMMEKCDVLVAHNMAFDGPFIALELARIGLSVPQVETFCTMENARWATPMGKKPSLGELCFALNKSYDPSKAHAADYDVDVMMACLFEGIDRGFFNLPGAKTKEEEQAA